MSRETQVLYRLQAIEHQVKEVGLWQSCAPDSEAFNSDEPFFMNTLAPLEWLQWVFLPRMQALLDAGAPLPVKLAIAPYYEVALEADMPGREPLLLVLKQLDDLFEHDA